MANTKISFLKFGENTYQINDKEALHSLSTASANTLGGIKLGYEATGQDNNYPVVVDGAGRAYVQVDWHDINTEYQIAINGSSQPNTQDTVNIWTSIYAPTTSGTTGQILKSNGANTAPTWVDAKASTDTLGLIKVFGSTTATITSGSGNNYGVKLDSNGKAYVNVPSSPIATSSTAGRIKSLKSYSSSGPNIPSTDMINELTHSTWIATNVGDRYYGVQTLEDGTAFVNVPWTDTTYNVASGGPGSNQTLSFGGTFIVPYISQSTSGQVSIVDRTITMPSIGEGTVADLQSKSSTSASTVAKVWSPKVLNEWMSDIIGVDLESIIETTETLEKILLEDNKTTTGIISQINGRVEKGTYDITTEPTATTTVVTNPTASFTKPTVNYTKQSLTHTSALLTATLGQTDAANDTLVFTFTSGSASLSDGGVSLSGGSVSISGGTYSTTLTGGSIILD